LSARGLAAFQRDSTALTERLAHHGLLLDSLRPRAADDSAVAAVALTPAIQRFRDFTGRYPEDGDAAATLLRLLSAAGDRAALDTIVDRIVGSAGTTGPSLVRAALTLHEEGLHAPAARLLEAALQRNPNDHGALAVLTRVYHRTGQGAPLLEVARRRMALAPLDPGAAQAMAVASDMAGWQDSTMKYLALADTGLGWNVHVAALTVGERNASLSGYVINVGPTARPATELVFEFLDAAGAVLGTATAPVPALEPRGRAQIMVRLEQSGAASWRYRRP
jgi:hypothetical protein